MKSLSKNLLIATLSCGMAVAAYANTATDSKSPQRAERMAKFEAERAELFKQADSNKDSKLTETEFATFKDLQKKAHEARKQEFEKNRFARLDSNKDGALSQDELKSAQIKRAGFKHRQHQHDHQHNKDVAAKPAI